MDVRERLLELLAAHEPEDEKEALDLAQLRERARTLAEPLSSAQQGAHFTASALVIDRGARHVCFVHHKKLGRWLQPGGHVEPSDGGQLELAALREAREETGLHVSLHTRAPRPLDVDVHAIPARPDAPGHDHLDVRFLVVAESTELHYDPRESLSVRWFSWEEALRKAGDPSLRRLLVKGRRFTVAIPR